MKSLSVLATAAVLSLAIASSSYSASKPIEIEPHVNVALPMGDFGDRSNLGIGGGAAVNFFVAPTFSVGARGGFTSFSGKTVNGYDAPNSSVFEVSALGRWYAGKMVSKAFFLEGDLGIHSVNNGGGSNFGFGGGAGKRFPLGTSGKTTLVPQAFFYSVSGDGGSSTFLMFRLGLAFGVNKSGE